MRQVIEILRLKHEQIREIARSCGIASSTVGDYLLRAEASGLKWPYTSLMEGLQSVSEDVREKAGDMQAAGAAYVQQWDEDFRARSKRGQTDLAHEAPLTPTCEEGGRSQPRGGLVGGGRRGG
jgi:hypothetical protein